MGDTVGVDGSNNSEGRRQVNGGGIHSNLSMSKAFPFSFSPFLLLSLVVKNGK